MKKANGEGTIYKRGNRWRGQLTLRGERVSVTGATKREVADKMAAIRTDFERGDYTTRNDITVREWCDFCMEHKMELREQSLIGYQGLFRNHVYPELGDTRIQSLDKVMLEQFYAKKFKDCNYSRSTVNSLSSRFKKILSYAVDDGILRKNPHENITLHKLRPPKKVEAYSLEDSLKILNYCKTGKPFEQIFYFLLCTGMRFGEAIALTWDDVDFEHGAIRICKTGVSIHGNMTIQERTKTEAGSRTIYVSENVLMFLSSVYDSQPRSLNYRNLVFPNSNWNIMHPTNARAHFVAICKKLGVNYMGIHALRHTYATRAFEKGVNVKVVSAMLGHKNIVTTLNIYQDVMPDMQRNAAMAIDEFGATSV